MSNITRKQYINTTKYQLMHSVNNFQGLSKGHRTSPDARCFSSLNFLSPVNLIPGNFHIFYKDFCISLFNSFRFSLTLVFAYKRQQNEKKSKQQKGKNQKAVRKKRKLFSDLSLTSLRVITFDVAILILNTFTSKSKHIQMIHVLVQEY